MNRVGSIEWQLANRTAERDALQVEIDRMRTALEWYAEPVLAYAITQEKEPRSAVHADGGRRAREALKSPAVSEGSCHDESGLIPGKDF
jgi:hypothetical protein